MIFHPGGHLTRALVEPRSLLAAVALTVTLACGGSDGETGPSAKKQTPNFVHLQSDKGDYVGAGATYDFSQANALLSVTSLGRHLQIGIDGDQSWTGHLLVPGTGVLVAGTYSNLPEYPSVASPNNAFVWWGDHRACGDLVASVTIDSVTYSSTTLTAIDLHFDQHCNSVPPALHGMVHWRSDDTTTFPGPVVPVPTNLWKPDPAWIPASGNYAILSSDPSEFIGRGALKTYASPPWTINVSSSASEMFVNMGEFTGSFVPMLGVSPIQVGYYGGLIAVPEYNKTKGGLSVSGNSSGCNKVTGWFAVDAITNVGTTVTALDMRFEQHCEGAAPALHGAIHWTRAP
jgi:hypothetical protein